MRFARRWPRAHRVVRSARRAIGINGAGVRVCVAVLVVMALVLAVGVAFKEPRSTKRRAFAELVAWNMAVRLRPVPETRTVKARTDRSRARRGTRGGYFGAVVFTEPGITCDQLDDPVSCGAKLEVYQHRQDAVRRADLLKSEGERVRVRGAFLLRVSAHEPAERWQSYQQAFLDALDRWKNLSDIAATDDEMS